MQAPQHIIELVKDLCDKAKVVPPTVRWNIRASRGLYTTPHDAPPRITVGPQCWTGAAQTLLHELAHHVVWARRKRLGHGRLFVAALQELVRYSGLDYNWRLEYRRVAYSVGVSPAAQQTRYDEQAVQALVVAGLSRDTAVSLVEKARKAT